MSTIDDSMEGRICMVTGGTGGLGLVTARALAQMGATVVVHGRSQQKAENVVNLIKEETGSTETGFLQHDDSGPGRIRTCDQPVMSRWL